MMMMMMMMTVQPLSVFLSSSQGLVGEKYGSIRVPGEVEAPEFEMILDAAVEAGLDTHILEEWYCRDENSVPPAYYLKPKAQMLKNYQNSVSSEPFCLKTYRTDAQTQSFWNDRGTWPGFSCSGGWWVEL